MIHRLALILLLIAPSWAGAGVKDLDFQLKVKIEKAAEELKFVDEAFFHDATMDTENGEDLGIYFKKRELFLPENKELFRNYAFHICTEIKDDTEYRGFLVIHFYQRTLIRKYNEEGAAECRFKDDKVKVEVKSRGFRYSQSVFKWTAKTLGGAWNLLVEDP
jgi:hypothetical protein